MPRRHESSLHLADGDAEIKARRDNPLFVNSLDKGFQILQAFCRDPRPHSLKDICRLSGLDKSAVQRFTHTLVTMGYLGKDERTRQYYPGVKILDLCYMYLCSDPLIDIAAPYLLDAREEGGESINMGRRLGLDVIYLVRLPSRKGRVPQPLIGGRAPIYCTATGRAMLSALPREEAESILDACELKHVTPHTIVDRGHILDKLDAAKHTGYTIAIQECLLTEITIAAPILNSHKQVVAAVNFSVTTHRWSIQRIEEELAPILLKAAHSISRSYGFPANYQQV